MTKDVTKDVPAQEQAFDSMVELLRKHKLELIKKQDKFCAHVEGELPSVCDSIPFCKKMTEEDRHPRNGVAIQS